MANPAESVISSRRHQFGVRNSAPREPADSLGDSPSRAKGLRNQVRTQPDKSGISQSALTKRQHGRRRRQVEEMLGRTQKSQHT